MTISLKELAAEIDAELLGNPNHMVDGCATLANAHTNQLSFIFNKKYAPALEKTNAGAVILSSNFANDCPVNALIVDNPYLSYAKAAGIIHQFPRSVGSVHSSVVIGEQSLIAEDCVIGPNVVIGKNVNLQSACRIGPGCFIDDGTVLGTNVTLVSNVTLGKGTLIGNNVTLHPGAVIGSDGFGYAAEKHKGGWVKIPQLGRVVIGNDVEIGANSIIDCGALDDTIIGNGVKIDNQVMIAHNVVIGDHTAIAACTGIAGSTKIGRHCTLAGGVGLVGHIEIADDVHITGMTMVTHSIKESGAYSSGTPFQTNKEWLKNAVRFKQLDKLTKKINQIINSQRES